MWRPVRAKSSSPSTTTFERETQSVQSHQSQARNHPSGAEVRDIFEGVVEAIGKIGHARGQGQLDDLAFVAELAHLLELGGAKGSGGARHMIGLGHNRRCTKGMDN